MKPEQERTVKRIEDILVKASEFHLPGARQLQQTETEIEVIIVDVAETEIERPKKTETLLQRETEVSYAENASNH